MRPSLPLLLAGVLVSAAGLAGCSTGSSDSAASSTAASTRADADAFPVTLEHAYGETTIEREPARVVAIGYTDPDMVVSLGVVPVGATKLTYGANATGSTDYFDQAVEALGGEAPTRFDDTDGINLAQIATLRPDVILGVQSGITEQDYAKLSKIAPTVAMPGVPYLTPWRTTLATVGRALGRTAEAEKVLTSTEDAIAAAKSEHPDLAGKSLMWTYLSQQDRSTVGVYGSKDTRVAALRDFGLVDPPAVLGAVKSTEFYASVSAERAGELESDLMFAFMDEGVDVATFEEDPLLGKIPALAEGHTYATDDEPTGLIVTNPTPLSIPLVIERVLPELDDALQGS
jgi:iron complex transport system substrate-binding protein